MGARSLSRVDAEQVRTGRDLMAAGIETVPDDFVSACDQFFVLEHLHQLPVESIDATCTRLVSGRSKQIVVLGLKGLG